MKYAIIGWTFARNPEYMDIDDSLKRAYLVTTVIKELRAKKYRICGSSHIGEKGLVPVFNSGEKFCVSERCWGGIMAQAMKEDNSDGMAYAKWLFYGFELDSKDLPELKVDKSRLARPGAVLEYEEPLDEEYYTIGPPRNAPRPAGNIVKPLFVSRKLIKR